MFYVCVCVCEKEWERVGGCAKLYIYVLRTAPLELFTRVEIRESVVPVLT